MLVVFHNEVLVPPAWRTGGVARCFNPALLRDGAGWLFAYRVVIEPTLERRIAICRLDDSFRIADGSLVALTDHVIFSTASVYPTQATTWFADPRLYRLHDRLFVYWNSGWHEPQNAQFLQELDGKTLLPLGSPREMVLCGERQKLEKNWALFEADGLYAVYSVNPHRVLAFSLHGTGPIEFCETSAPIPNPRGYAQTHGGLRGGSPPQRHGEQFYSFCHSIENDPAGYRYVAGVYRFAATPPFAPMDMPQRPLAMEIPANARRALPKLNPAVGDVIYPAGAAFHEGRWVMSFGIDDERCAIAILEHRAVLDTLSRL